MRRLRTLGLSLAALAVVLAAPAATAKTPPTQTKRTAAPVVTLALDGSRVAYATGGKVYVWNLANGATSVVKGSYSKYSGELAIAGTRVAVQHRRGISGAHEHQVQIRIVRAGDPRRAAAARRRRHRELAHERTVLAEDLDPIVDGIEGVAAFIASASDGQVVFI